MPLRRAACDPDQDPLQIAKRARDANRHLYVPALPLRPESGQKGSCMTESISTTDKDGDILLGAGDVQRALAGEVLNRLGFVMAGYTTRTASLGNVAFALRAAYLQIVAIEASKKVGETCDWLAEELLHETLRSARMLRGHIGAPARASNSNSNPETESILTETEISNPNSNSTPDSAPPARDSVAAPPSSDSISTSGQGGERCR